MVVLRWFRGRGCAVAAQWMLHILFPPKTVFSIVKRGTFFSPFRLSNQCFRVAKNFSSIISWNSEKPVCQRMTKSDHIFWFCIKILHSSIMFTLKRENSSLHLRAAKSVNSFSQTWTGKNGTLLKGKNTLNRVQKKERKKGLSSTARTACFGLELSWDF